MTAQLESSESTGGLLVKLRRRQSYHEAVHHVGHVVPLDDVRDFLAHLQVHRQAIPVAK